MNRVARNKTHFHAKIIQHSYIFPFFALRAGAQNRAAQGDN
jgi:hypothetical protein